MLASFGILTGLDRSKPNQYGSGTMPSKCDVLIIGSGFGGSVLACRLAAAGRRVVVLERGRRWAPKSYPRSPTDDWIWDEQCPQKQNGWIDFRDFGDMKVVQGAAVGGGSLIYANVSVEAKKFVFENGWPINITYKALKPHYATVGKMLNVQTIPNNQLTKRFRLMKKASNAIGEGTRFRKLPLAVTFSKHWNYGLCDRHSAVNSKCWINPQGRSQGTCVHCGNCDIGCRFGAKNTLDLNYLAVAEDNNAEIRPLHIARYIQPMEGCGYIVHFEKIEDQCLIRGSISAKVVIVACGSIGSTELLLRCRDEYRTLPKISTALGHRWSSNGDFLTPAIYKEHRVFPTVGPTITCAIDFLDGSINGNRFFVEDGGFPDVVGNTIGEFLGLLGKSVSGSLKNCFSDAAEDARNQGHIDCVMPWFGQAIDASNGTLKLGRPWWKPFGKSKLMLDWDITNSKAAMETMIKMHKRLSIATGGIPVVPPTWTFMRDLVTPHPLGGCRMSDNQADGVTNENGEVYGYPGLYVSDGSIIPTALGLNPSRTIAAIAELHAESMIRKNIGV